MARDRRTLLVRHLPPALPAAEKSDLLRHFGASDVRVMGTAGKLRNTAFATFPSEAAAAKALRRLHQLEVLGSMLAVEFARSQDVASTCEPLPAAIGHTTGNLVESVPAPPKTLPLDAIAPKLGVMYSANPLLRYHYPAPTANIFTNICHALSSSPRFYTQVLHLMNKMNLPAPFGHVTSRPPLVADLTSAHPVAIEQLPPLPPEAPPRENEPPAPPEPEPEEVEMEVSSDEESEYESDEDEHTRRLKTMMDTLPALLKRPLGKKKMSKRKRPKLKDLLVAPKAPASSSQPALTPAQVFEQPAPAVSRKIAISLPTRPLVHADSQPASPVDPLGERVGKEEREEVAGMGLGEEGQGAGGFGKMFPAPTCPSPNRSDDEREEEEEEHPSQFISRKELSSGRVSREEMEKSSVFKNYSAGEPTCRLYVKNLSRQVVEQDLKHIFGRYVDFSSDVEKNMFDVRLMREGRMKGQAFVGLPSERAAQKALRDAHGFVLHGRPLVIQFARSARPKEDPKLGSKSSRDVAMSNHPGRDAPREMRSL